MVAMQIAAMANPRYQTDSLLTPFLPLHRTEKRQLKLLGPQPPPDSWCSPELLLRLQAQRQASSSDGRDQAVAMLLRSMEIAEWQNALSWQLRGAIDLASLYREMRRAPEGRRVLSTVYDCYTEGHETLDLRRARALLGDLEE